MIIADAPQNDADFDCIRRIARLDDIRDFYSREMRFPVGIYDLRREAATKIVGVIVGHTGLPGDPAGYLTVNLGAHSAFEEISHLCHKLYGAEYDRAELVDQGNGPLDPRPLPAGVVLAGTNPIAVDLACARLMGFDYRRVPMLYRALQPHALPFARFCFDQVVGRSNDPDFNRILAALSGPLLAFEPHFGWKGHIEVSEHASEVRALA